MARFQREAKVLASLDHRNIASIYGLEASDSTRALVMELVQGPTLADRIHQGPIPIEDVLKIARQMADALEYAHEKSIIQRDLKPANLKVAADDTLKILDFGLAKALEGEAASVSSELYHARSVGTLGDHEITNVGVLRRGFIRPENEKGTAVFGAVWSVLLAGLDMKRGTSQVFFSLVDKITFHHV